VHVQLGRIEDLMDDPWINLSYPLDFPCNVSVHSIQRILVESKFYPFEVGGLPIIALKREKAYANNLSIFN
jgi:hypothetical protein